MRRRSYEYLMFAALTIGLLFAGAAMPATMDAPKKSPTGAPVAVPADAADDIRDVRAPKPIPGPWPWIAAGCGAALLATLAWLILRARGDVRAPSPRDIALRRLDAARKWMATERARDFCYEVSETIRCYIEQRFRIYASRETTEEFFHELLQSSEPGLVAHREALSDFLSHCDLAKYAGWQFATPEMESMLVSARAFVTLTSEEDKAGGTADAAASEPGAPATVGGPA